MRIKKEQIIIVLIILALLLYLVLRKQDKIGYQLPDFPDIPRTAITSIEIIRPGDSIILNKEDENWVISPQGYQVNSSHINHMLDFLGAPILTAMVSDSKSYTRYGLDKDKRIIVRAFVDKDLKREIELGNSTDSRQLTFVKLAGDHRIYHATGNQRDNFDKNIDEFRDKNVLTFDENKIREIRLTKDALPIILTRVTLKVTEQEEEYTGSPEPEDDKFEWQTPEGEKVDKSPVDDLLSTLSGLTCKSFLYEIDEGDMTDPLCSITLKGQKEYTVTVFSKKEDDEGYPAVCSEIDSPFILSDWKAEKIIEKPDELLEKPEDSETTAAD